MRTIHLQIDITLDDQAVGTIAGLLGEAFPQGVIQTERQRASQHDRKDAKAYPNRPVRPMGARRTQGMGECGVPSG